MNKKALWKANREHPGLSQHRGGLLGYSSGLSQKGGECKAAGPQHRTSDQRMEGYDFGNVCSSQGERMGIH